MNGVILMYQICYKRIWFDIQHVYHKNEWRYKYYDIKHTYFWYSLDSEDQKWHSDGADTQPRAPESRRLSLLVDCWLRSIICSIPSIHIHHIPSFQLRDQVTVYASIPRLNCPVSLRARANILLHSADQRYEKVRIYRISERSRSSSNFEFQIFQIQSSKPKSTIHNDI